MSASSADRSPEPRERGAGFISRRLHSIRQASTSGHRSESVGDRELRRFLPVRTSGPLPSNSDFVRSRSSENVRAMGISASSSTASPSFLDPATRIIDPREKLYPIVMDPKRAPQDYAFLTLRELTDHVIGKTKRAPGAKKGLSTALQLALDCSVPSNKLRAAACADLVDGTILATTSTFRVTPDEVMALQRTLDDSIAAFETGVVIEGVKYEPLRADDQAIYAQKAMTGVIILRTSHFVVIGYYDESIATAAAVAGAQQLCAALEAEQRLPKADPWSMPQYQGGL